MNRRTRYKSSGCSEGLIKSILLSLLLFISPALTYSQTTGAGIDSVRLRKAGESELKEKAADQDRKQVQNRNLSETGLNKRSANQNQGARGRQGAPGNQAAQSAKQIHSARPDMARAKGARPPTIVRPTGSGIPKGIGKPGGAVRRGGR